MRMNSTKKTKLLLIAAPFGFGPAARALLLARAFCEHAEITLFSNMDALRFIERFRPPSTLCRGGIFKQVYPDSVSLENFDYFISLNNDPAVNHLIKHGFADKTIFLDSILPWRAEQATIGFPRPIRGYLVQDFPGTSSYLDGRWAQTVELTAPAVWTSRTSRQVDDCSPKIVTLHFGGATSPVVGWKSVSPLLENISLAALKLARHFAHKLVILGNPNASSLAVSREPDILVMGGVSPPEAAKIIERSAILLTTPGISAIYEAFACQTPCIVLPPMNSTQLHQYRVFINEGLPGSIDSTLERILYAKTSTMTWDKQSLHCIAWLSAHLAPALGRLEAEMTQMLDPASGLARREEVNEKQLAFFNRLSGQQLVEVLAKIIL